MQVCHGYVTLHHHDHEFPLKITSSELRNDHDQRNPRKPFKAIKKRHPVTNETLKYVTAKASGNCCWIFGERKRGGRSFSISRPATDTEGWSIQKVTLDLDCAHVTVTDTRACESEVENCEAQDKNDTATTGNNPAGNVESNTPKATFGEPNSTTPNDFVTEPTIGQNEVQAVTSTEANASSYDITKTSAKKDKKSNTDTKNRSPVVLPISNSGSNTNSSSAHSPLLGTYYNFLLFCVLLFMRTNRF